MDPYRTDNYLWIYGSAWAKKIYNEVLWHNPSDSAGIGSGVDKKELDEMAGGHGKAFTAQSFDELIGKDFVKKLTQKSCETGKLTENI